jgi:molybdopterin synthase sulfur carrier subunit
MIRVLFFGPVAERVGARNMQLAFSPGMRLHDVAAQLKTRHPQAFEIVCFTAVNDRQTGDMQLLLADDDEIAFMAKFSGG